MLIIVLGALLAVAAWIAAVDGLYPLPEPRPSRLTTTTVDGWTLTVWYRPAATRRHDAPVILCPGLANNATLFDLAPPQSLAAYLNHRGFDCYAVDLRGAGGSSAPDGDPWDVSVDDYVLGDVPAVLDLLERRHGPGPRLWVGHSLGGLVGLAASGHALAGRLAGIVTIGSPVFFRDAAFLRPLLKLGQWLAPWGAFDSSLMRYLAPLAGRAPSPARGSTNLDNIEAGTQRLAAANLFAPMWRGVLGQLEDWLGRDVFGSRDGRIDYRAATASLEAPLLVIGGSVDQLVPESATRAYFELVASSPHRRSLALFGRAHGQADEYGHGDLLLGRRAHLDVYPVIADFLEVCASTSR
jgi:pimeloyl-ACP methyl ester carboxylesterase